MRARDRARALAVDVEVADVEITEGTLDFVARLRVHSARQSKFCVIGDFERVLEILRFDHRQHRPKDFFLLEFGLGRNVSEDGWLQEVSLACVGRAAAARRA